mmetsp:Transcript_61729/g.198958  ORF Transcript_61729/g.198958 Transcript_61729/m.198958 type:complete len:203 (+) Transcript_61729:1841-2449(+)
MLRVQEPLRERLGVLAELPQTDVAHEHAPGGQGADWGPCRAIVAVAQERRQARGDDPLPHLHRVPDVLPVVGPGVGGAVAIYPGLEAPLQLLPVPDLQVQDDNGDEEAHDSQRERQSAEGVVAVHAPLQPVDEHGSGHDLGVLPHVQIQLLLGVCFLLQLPQVILEWRRPDSLMELCSRDPILVLVSELIQHLHLSVRARRL